MTGDRKEVPLICISDAHVGSRDFNQDVFLNIIKLAKEIDALIILNGDLLENSSKISVADGWANQKHLCNDQMNYVVDRLMPIKDQIIGITAGNHEWRSYNNGGIDLTQSIAQMLGKIDVYTPTAFYGYITQKYKGQKTCYNVLAVHGTRGAKNDAAFHAGTGRDFFGGVVDGFDIVIRGHAHKNSTMPFQVLRANPKSTTIRETEIYSVAPGHYLNYHKSYAERASMPRSPIGTQLLNLQFSASGEKEVKYTRIK
jgi:predicted phosphodiesterase